MKVTIEDDLVSSIKDSIKMGLVLKHIKIAGEQGIRFNELMRSLWKYWSKLSPATLSSYLKTLTEMGYVTVEVKTVGRTVEIRYKITEEGTKKLKEFIDRLIAVTEFLKTGVI